MERLTNNRPIYLDYNSTSPLSQTVVEFLSKGDFDYRNPSSVHRSGKFADRQIRNVRESFFVNFGLNPEQCKLFFHSGATEGINTILKGFAEYHLSGLGKGINLFYAQTDHAAVHNVAGYLEKLGHKIYPFAVDSNGDFSPELLIEQIRQVDGPVLLNYTCVNNETGVVWDLEKAAYIKQQTGCAVHVDAAQLVGRIATWSQLSPLLDSYTFSGHKFGALKGVGFTFVANDFFVAPLLHGGGQQGGLRSGTGNVLGIKSCQLALDEMRAACLSVADVRNYLEDFLKNLFGDKGEIVGQGAACRALNTVCLLINGQKADIVAAALDMEGIEVSTGSACSAGIFKGNRVLQAMGYDERRAKSAIRISFAPATRVEEMSNYCLSLEKVLKRFL